jgi:hypothetical protein
MIGDHDGGAGRATLLVRAADEILGTHNMIGDHHGRMAGRSTLLVRALDGILGTHGA